MKHALFTLILISALSQSNAQSKLIQGVVFELGTSTRVSRASISNSSHENRSQTNGLGIFTIAASPGDTLKISKEGFTDQSVVVSSYQDLVIHLSKPIMLNQVTVPASQKNRSLTKLNANTGEKDLIMRVSHHFSLTSSLHSRQYTS